MKDKEVTAVDAREPLWPAMVFLATLAYPESFDRRDRAILAMKAMLYRAARALGKPVGRDAKQVLAAMPVQQQNGSIRRLNGRLHKRVIAGAVAAQLLSGVRKTGRKERISPQDQRRKKFALMSRGVPAERAERMTMKVRVHPGPPHTLNDFARRYPGGEAKFKSDAWRPEIIRLMLAFNAVRVAWRDPRGFSVPRLLANPEWSIPALKSAETYARCLSRTTNLPASMRKAVRSPPVRLVPMEVVDPEISEPVGDR